MAVFTFPSDYDASQSNEPRIRKSQFTDGGYEHRIRFGLNTNPETFNVPFMSRTDSEADQIMAFFDARGGSEAFDWTSPLTNRRNLLTWTEDLTQSAWTKTNLTGVAADIAGYTGGSNAFGLVSNATNGFHVISQQIAVPASTNTTTSLYVKKGVGRDAIFNVYGTTDFHGVNLNLNTGVATLGTSGSPTTTDWGAARVGSDGWWRLWVTGRPDNGTVRRLDIVTTSAAGAQSYAGDASSTYLFVMGPQIEYGTLTGYQPMLGAPPAPKWVCEKWDRQFISCGKNNITATFRQVYES